MVSLTQYNGQEIQTCMDTSILTNSILVRPTKLILTLIALGNNFVEWVYGWQRQAKGFKYTLVFNK